MSRLSWLFHVDSVPMTKAVVAGETSLGGSESACLGLARALKARGHDVTIAATRMDTDVPEIDHAGVRWIASESLKTAQILIDPDVFVALRQPHVFGLPVQARYRILWNQDMLVGAKEYAMAFAWAYDEIAYVSQYHRKQWEGVVPELAPIGWVTKNGYDASLVPTGVAKVPNRIIHISRPERAMTPLLAMWPELKKRVPDAELHICRYQSMYDGEGSNVKAMVEGYDREIAKVQEAVGGIVQLGHLNKRDLYRAIASASVMWYPGVVDFAETSCIAAIEAQACGTPIVCSYKGALPETAPHARYAFGDAMSPEYQAESIKILVDALSGTTALEVARGREHVQSYTYDAIAAEWEAHIWERFDARAQAKDKIVAALLHEDDHVSAKALTADPDIIAECDRVIRGEAQTAEHYGHFALDPEAEMTTQKTARHDAVVEAFSGCKNILDLACGNGAFALLLAQADQTRHVTGYDYSRQNIDAAEAASVRHGLADRVTFLHETVCELESGRVLVDHDGAFDGLFLGEFCEHIGGITRFLNETAALVGPGVRAVVTVPSGPFSELLPVDLPKQKGHVHHFRPRDLEDVFGAQQDFTVDYLDCGYSPRGKAVGHWIVRFTTSATPFGERPLTHWHRTMRPKAGLSVGMIVSNATKWLTTCLSTVHPVADEIVVLDTGSDDRKELEHICDRFNARLYSGPPVRQLEGGFSQARNLCMSQTAGDWFLWIDADEELVGHQGIHKYLESGVFRGYAINQNHLMLDCPPHADTPVRLFKKGPDIEFYGCVHEQPQQGDCNGDVMPALQVYDVQIAHTGYLHEGIRRTKSTLRNLPLLLRDRMVFPARKLGLVLWLRDCVTQAAWKLERSNGEVTPEVADLWSQAVGIFEQHFLDPDNKYHKIARPFYEQAVCRIRGALEVETALGGAVQGLKGRHAEPKRFWVRTPSQIKPMLDYYQREALKVYAPGPAIDVEPWVPQPEGVAA